jgi:hypothetical protein
MSLEHAFFVSQIIASIALVASLIFVGLQVRDNTTALQRNEHNSTMAQWTVIRMAVASATGDPCRAASMPVNSALLGALSVCSDKRPCGRDTEWGDQGHVVGFEDRGLASVSGAVRDCICGNGGLGHVEALLQAGIGVIGGR